MPRVVLFDTNILLSGVGWRGNPYRCLELARSAVVEGVTCRELLEELAEKLQVKLDFSPAQATDTVVDLLSFLRLVTITKPTLRGHVGPAGNATQLQGPGPPLRKWCE